MALILRGEDAKDWVYKGEGAANLVLSYIGSSCSLIGKVLRIKKVPRENKALIDEVQSANGCFVLSKNEQLLWGDFKELVGSTSTELAGQAYVQQVMGPLLDPRHIDGGVRISVCREFLEAIQKNVHCQRPAWRIEAAEVDTRCDSALLISDHSVFLSSKGVKLGYLGHDWFRELVLHDKNRKSSYLLDGLFQKKQIFCQKVHSLEDCFIPGTIKEDMCFTIEIKPKCGFLPSSEFIAKRNAVKKCITRFRMHQLLKLHEGEISQLSGYDPLDLFSGSKDRIHQAITALFTVPGNNFRIFLNGSLIFGGLGGGMDITAVRSPEVNEQIDAFLKVSGLQRASFVELLVEALLKSAVLDKLLAAQKLDLLDIEGAIHLYYNIVSEPCLVCKDVIDTELWHQYSFLHSFSLEKSLKIVREYLIAATAKDCSLMLSFRPTDLGARTDEYSSIFLKSCNQSFDYKANFIDLDRKSLNKMVYYYKLDQKIVDYYTKNFMVEERTCTSTTGCSEDKQVKCQQ